MCVYVCVCHRGGFRGGMVSQLAASGSSVPRGYPAWRKLAALRQLGPGCQPRHNLQTHRNTKRDKRVRNTGGRLGLERRQKMGFSLRKAVIELERFSVALY